MPRLCPMRVRLKKGFLWHSSSCASMERSGLHTGAERYRYCKSNLALRSIKSGKWNTLVFWAFGTWIVWKVPWSIKLCKQIRGSTKFCMKQIEISKIKSQNLFWGAEYDRKRCILWHSHWLRLSVLSLPASEPSRAEQYEIIGCVICQGQCPWEFDMKKGVIWHHRILRLYGSGAGCT
jgi:hypothetical protein